LAEFGQIRFQILGSKRHLSDKRGHPITSLLPWKKMNLKVIFKSEIRLIVFGLSDSKKWFCLLKFELGKGLMECNNFRDSLFPHKTTFSLSYSLCRRRVCFSHAKFRNAFRQQVFCDRSPACWGNGFETPFLCLFSA